MPQVNPKVINQQPVDTGQEISADGNPIQQAAAPQGLPRIAPQQVNEPVEPVVEQQVEQQTVEPKQADETKAKEQPVIDLSDFLAVKNDGVKPVEQKPEEPKPVVTEQKKEVQTAPAQPKTDARDFTGIDEADQPLFTKMSNESFAKLKPIYITHKEQTVKLQQKDAEIAELKKGKTTIPDSYYEHPQGFVLTPEFGEVASKVNQSQQVLQHWENELTKVRGGAAKFNMLLRDQQGNFVTQEVPADEKAEVTLLNMLDFARNQYNEFNSELKSIARTYSEKSRDASTWVSNFEKQTFPMFDDPKFTAALTPLVDQVIKNLPAPYRNSPTARVLAKSLVLNNQLILNQQQLLAKQPAAQQQQAQPGQRPKNINPADVAKAGPTAQQAAADGNGGTNGKGDVSFDMFEAVKNS